MSIRSESFPHKDFEFFSQMIKTSKLVFVDMESEFSFELAQQLYGSTQIIDFDWAYSALGYSTKGNAKRMLTSYFEQDFDYFVVTSNESASALPYEIFTIEVENPRAR